MPEPGDPSGPTTTTGPAGSRLSGAVPPVAELLPRRSAWKPALRAPGADVLSDLVVASASKAPCSSPQRTDSSSSSPRSRT